ncbi:MAG: AAA family ATPase [Deltaproteobacteria bacterium]|nr:AAA family ATPase [Deltaproteobacteria bacterium]
MNGTRERGRAGYAIRRVRLINFHNLVNETIDVPNEGHLFLLGDNGSGKTTVLDAIHYVLSGGQDLELNAAARIGGRRDEGRSLQGIVLRLDPERGLLNEGGAIAYSALELQDESGERICVGIGTEATSLEARVSKWGFLHRGALEEVPLLVDVPEGGMRPVTRDELRDRLGKLATFGQASEYRKALADRLFGGMVVYEEVCRFWSMAKAYREIVAGARDFGTLFGRLLPAPDSDVFAEILRSLRQVDELEVVLRDLGEQRAYVASIVELAGEVAKQREAVARYTWLERFRELEKAQERAELMQQELTRLDEDMVRVESDVLSAQGNLDAAEESLRAAAMTDSDGILTRLHTAEAELAERRGEVARLEGLAQAALRRRESSAKSLKEAREHLASSFLRAVSALEKAVASAATMPGALGESAKLAALFAARASEMTRGDSPIPTDDLDSARAVDQATRVRNDSSRRVKELAPILLRAQDALYHAARELERLRAEGSALPQVEGLAQIMRVMEENDLDSKPLCLLLSPRPDAPLGKLAALEALLGDETLAALCPAPQDTERVLQVVRTHAPHLRVVTRSAPDAELPSWVRDILERPTTDAEEVAWCALATWLAQPSSLGPVPPPGEQGELDHRGMGFRATEGVPCLIGAEARARSYRRCIEEQELKCRALEEEVAKTKGAVRAAEDIEAQIDAVLTALAQLQAPAVLHAHALALRAEQEHGHAQELEANESTRVDLATSRLGQAKGLVDTMRARVLALGLDELALKLDMLKETVAEARRKYGLAIEARALMTQRREDTSIARENLNDAIDQLNSDLRIRGDALRRHLGMPLDEAALERYVRVQCRGDQFRTLEAIRDRMHEAARAEQSAADELERDGGRGVRNLNYAARFGFTYDRAQNRLEDRRQQPATSVLAQLDRDLNEQHEVVSEKTRELMNKLVMGTLARHLQEQVDRLDRMVRSINRLLDGLRFGTTQYHFSVVPKPDRRELVELVKKVRLLDEDSRVQFRHWIDERLAELRSTGDGDVPELLDYRRWFDYRLRMQSASSEGIELTRELRTLGSGGEQGVPNYLLVLSLAKLMFDNAGARVRPLLFDEAFYGIDAGRRDQLLRFATELGLQLFVASPDQDGVTPAVRHATTLFLVKDESGDVHMAPYHYWNHSRVAQPSLFDVGKPDSAPPDEASCSTLPTRAPAL